MWRNKLEAMARVNNCQCQMGCAGAGAI